MKLINLILLVTAIVGGVFYWFKNQEVTEFAKVNKRLTYHYSLLEIPEAEAELCHFSLHPLKRAHTYQWTGYIGQPTQAQIQIGKESNVSFLEPGTMQFTISTRLRTGSLRYFFGIDDSNSGLNTRQFTKKISQNKAFTQHLVTHWDRIKIEFAGLNGPIKSDLSEPVILFKRTIPKDLLEELREVAPREAARFDGHPLLEISIHQHTLHKYRVLTPDTKTISGESGAIAQESANE